MTFFDTALGHTNHILSIQSNQLRGIFEDWMARTLLMACKISINKAAKKEKERLFQSRKERRKAFQQVVHIAQDKTQLLDQVRQLAWLDISPLEKEKRLQELLPRNQDAEQDQMDELEQIKEEQNLHGEDHYYQYLAEESQSLQQRATPIIKKLTFNPSNSNENLLEAIKHFYAT